MSMALGPSTPHLVTLVRAPARRPILVTFDGPKGTGKTTLLDGVLRLIPAQMEVVHLVEKSLDPHRLEIRALLETHRGRMTPAIDLEIASLMVQGRAWISREILDRSRARLILMERWIASEAAFRMQIPFENCLELNRHGEVREPELVVAVVCEPDEAWRRAHARPSGLGSQIITSLAGHRTSCERFETAANRHGWWTVQTDGHPEIAISIVAQAILAIIERMIEEDVAPGEPKA